MSSRNIFSSQLFRLSALLSQRVSAKDKFFKETALMDTVSREQYAIIYWINETNIINEDLANKNIDEILEKFILPLIQRLGQSKFQADVLTHLGFKVGEEMGIGDYDLGKDKEDDEDEME